jgi:hypothetical protein
VSESLQLQQLCERGQELLIATDYIGAEATLVEAEAIALRTDDFDTLSRLYMPLQEARRQRRQRCGEGIVRLEPIDNASAESILEKYPHGQLLVMGAEAMRVRQLQRESGLYVETFLGVWHEGRVGIIPERGVPPSFHFDINELPHGDHRGTVETFARVMQLWEQLHAAYLEAADAMSDARQKIAGYRRTIEVDYACELAHQRLSAAAAQLARSSR